MTDTNVKCPECGHEFALGKNLAGPLLAEERKKYEKRLADERAKMERKAKAEAQEIAKKELLEKTQQAEDMRRRLADMNTKLAEAQKEQVEMLKKKRELEDKERELDLTLQKRLAAEGAKIRAKARAEIETEHTLKLREQEQQNQALRKQIDDLKRRAEQGSQQHQGEVLETALEDLLRQHFPYDEIIEIKKGESGADVLQKVMSPNGKICGSILWETKRTKNWSGSWIPKLKSDQRNCGAELAVLLSTCLPKELERGNFAQIDGVWVTGFETAMSMVGALRMGLIDMNNVMAVRDGQASKAEQVYDYLTGTRFRHRVEAIVEKFSLMREDLEREKKVMVKNWAKREGQIEAVIGATLGMYGDLEAIAGKAMPDIDGLEDDTPLLE